MSWQDLLVSVPAWWRWLQPSSARYALPVIGYLAAVLTVIYGWNYMHEAATASNFVAGHVICGVGFITACVATTATASTRFTLIRAMQTVRSGDVNAVLVFIVDVRAEFAQGFQMEVNRTTADIATAESRNERLAQTVQQRAGTESE